VKDLRDKKVLVTGAASGIGRATAIAAAREGAEVYLTDINAPQLDAVVAEIRAAGGKVASARAFDIADFEAVRAFADAIHAAHGRLVDGRVRDAAAARRHRVAELPAERRELLITPVDQDDAPAGGGESLGARAADAARGAGDERGRGSSAFGHGRGLYRAGQ